MPVIRLADELSWSMFVAAHRSHAPRRRRVPSACERVLVFAADPDIRRWIEHELFGERVTTDYVDSPAEVVARLTLVPPPWPQLLVVEAALLPCEESETLGAIRQAGWPGMVIAIGEVSDDVERALSIDRVLSRRLGSEILRSAIRDVGAERPTVPFRRLRSDDL